MTRHGSPGVRPRRRSALFIVLCASLVASGCSEPADTTCVSSRRRRTDPDAPRTPGHGEGGRDRTGQPRRTTRRRVSDHHLHRHGPDGSDPAGTVDKDRADEHVGHDRHPRPAARRRLRGVEPPARNRRPRPMPRSCSWGTASDASQGWDDYKDVDVRGKILLMLIGSPHNGARDLLGRAGRHLVRSAAIQVRGGAAPWRGRRAPDSRHGPDRRVAGADVGRDQDLAHRDSGRGHTREPDAASGGRRTG